MRTTIVESPSRARAVLFCLGLTVLAACGSGDAPSSSSRGKADAADSASASVSAADSPVVAPDSIADLVNVVPKDASAVVSVPSLDAFKANIPADTLKQALDDLSGTLAPNLGMAPATISKLLEGYEGAVVFALGGAKDPKGAAAIRVKDISIIKPALEDAKFESKGNGEWLLPGTQPISVAVLEKARVVIVANDATALRTALATAAGKQPSFATAPNFRKREAGGIWLAVDFATLTATTLPGTMDAGSKLIIGLSPGAQGGLGKFDLEYTQVSANVPRLGQVLAAGSQSTMKQLPSGAVAALGLSIKRAPGKTLSDFLVELGRAGNDKIASNAEAVLQAGAKISLADLDRALGDDIAVGVYYSGGKISDLSAANTEVTKSGALVFDIATRDDGIASGLVASAANALGSQKGFKKETNGFSLDAGSGLTLTASPSPGNVRVIVGGPAVVTKLRAADVKTPDNLAAQPLFKTATESAAASSHLALYLDFAALNKVLPMETTGLTALGDQGNMLTITLAPSDKGVDLVAASAGGAGAVAVIGSMSAVAIYGVRRYLANAKTSEAKNTIGAIARGAVGAFEREQTGTPAHALCKPAGPVPTTVPSGRKYQPQAGADFDTGSETAGWKCLRFTMTNPHYYQYYYRVGGNYKGPKRGGPDPGADGFEASAEGDLDGDGVTSLFTLTGKLDAATNSVKVSPQLYVVDEFE